MWSLWERETYGAPAQLIVIGAGLTGMSSALLYKQRFPKDRVVVLERGNIPQGASTRNAGFACFGSPTELLEDWDIEGLDSMLHRVDLRWRGLKRWMEWLGPESMDYQNHGGWEVFRPSEADRQRSVSGRLGDLNKALETVIGASVFIEDKDISRFGFQLHPIAFSNPHEGQLHSGKLCRALEKKARDIGVEFYFGTEIKAVEEQSNGVEIRDVQGHIWQSERVLVAANGLSNALLGDLNILPARGQILVTEAIPDCPIRGCFHLDAGYWYFRNAGNRILLGGGRNLFREQEQSAGLKTTQAVQDALEKVLFSEILPGRKVRIEHRWAGTMAFGRNNEKTPVVQAQSERIFVAGRLGGMGVAMAPIIAEQAVDLLT